MEMEEVGIGRASLGELVSKEMKSVNKRDDQIFNGGIQVVRRRQVPNQTVTVDILIDLLPTLHLRTSQNPSILTFQNPRHMPELAIQIQTMKKRSKRRKSSNLLKFKSTILEMRGTTEQR